MAQAGEQGPSCLLLLQFSDAFEPIDVVPLCVQLVVGLLDLRGIVVLIADQSPHLAGDRGEGGI